MMDPQETKLADEPRNHPFLWVIAFFFLVLSVPFYYPSGREPDFILGLPDWCWVTIFADTCFAATVAFMILFTWKEEETTKEPIDGNSSGS